ncbi:hypothetical protein [Burkholderia sp. Z1]|uniref:hypothetical protein n=1 Tax=Burkholderia sp. Z1 TaxID=2759039 RepID=UPI0018677528|nr:hypothetical protein [Burkholderia sp. Z1]
MSKRKAPQIYTVPLFGGEVVVCKSRAEWAYAMRHYGQDDDSERFGGGRAMSLVDTATRQRSYIVGVFDGSIGTLSHELAHACFYILDSAGVKVEDGGTNETFCYMLGHLMFTALPDFGAPTHAEQS